MLGDYQLLFDLKSNMLAYAESLKLTTEEENENKNEQFCKMMVIGKKVF